MRSASPRIVLLVTALFSIRPVHAAIAGVMAPDEAGLRVMISLGVAWVLVGILTGVSRSFLFSHDNRPEGPHDSASQEDS